MSNKIRYYMADEVSELLPLLHETYMWIGRFQKKRSSRNEAILIEHLDKTSIFLQRFKSIIQFPKQVYFDAILKRDLDISDRIIALDTAVGAMHIEFQVPRMYAHQESAELRRALDACRLNAVEDSELINDAKDEKIICRGIPASSGITIGNVFIWDESISYSSIPDGCIIVANMTRPEIALAIHKVCGIITNVGGRLCHAAILAIEKNLPCIVGTGNATEVLTPNLKIRIDGTLGFVYKE